MSSQELVIDKVGDQIHPRFLIYDIMKFEVNPYRRCFRVFLADFEEVFSY